MNRTRTVFVAGMLSGAAVCALLSAWINSPVALAQTPPLVGRGAAPAGSQQTAGIDDRKLESVYANYFMFSTTNDEVITDFGFVRPNTAAAAANQPDNIFDARTRLITSWSTTKKLHDALGTLLTKYETLYGPIRTEAPTPRTVSPVLPPPK